MYYKFRNDFVYSTFCIVEASDLEEAKRIAMEEAEWETDDGGEHYLEYQCIKASESLDDIDEQDEISWTY